jgi:ribosomal subunit interface protein
VEVRITGRHSHLGEKVKNYTLEKLGPLSRYYARTRYLEVVFDEDTRGHAVEVKAHLQRGQPLVATVRNKDPFAAVDLAHDKIERMLTREKEKKDERRREAAQSNGPKAAPSPAAGEEE